MKSVIGPRQAAAAAWLLGAGLAGAVPAYGQPDAAVPEDLPAAQAQPAPATDEIAQDARYLLHIPDFVRTAAGETSIVARLVRFCTCTHLATNTWSFEALDEEKLDRRRDMLQSALAKYPLDLLSDHLECVYFLKPRSMKQFFNGQWSTPPLGTYGLKSLYISVRGDYRPRGWSLLMEAVFHHELSSILIGHHPQLFRNKDWKSANAPEFAYRYKPGRSPQATTNFLPEGFVCSYGMANLENDVNTYAMWLFTRADWLLDQASRHPRVQRKVDLLIDFYGKLDPVYTREFFLRHCRTALTAEEKAQVDARTRAIADNPDAAEPYGKRARLYCDLELYPDAIRDAETALQINPRYAPGHSILGRARIFLEMYEAGAEACTRAIECDPSLVAAYRQRALAYEKLGRPVEAAQDRKTADEIENARTAREEGD
mgnify:CR=1 FL=1